MWCSKIRAYLESSHQQIAFIMILRKRVFGNNNLYLLRVFSLHLLEVVQVLQWTAEEVFRVVLDVVTQGLIDMDDLELIAFKRQIVRIVWRVWEHFHLRLELKESLTGILRCSSIIVEHKVEFQWAFLGLIVVFLDRTLTCVTDVFTKAVV